MCVEHWLCASWAELMSFNNNHIEDCSLKDHQIFISKVTLYQPVMKF